MLFNEIGLPMDEIEIYPTLRTKFHPNPSYGVWDDVSWAGRLSLHCALTSCK